MSAITTGVTGAGKAQGTDKPVVKPELAAAAKSFEAVFLRKMIASMRAPSLGDELFGSDAGSQFRDMSDARLAENMAGGFGIADMLSRQLAGK